MYKRDINLTKSNSFFLFGARGTGKSTLVREFFKNQPMLEIDLLDPAEAEEALLGLEDLKARIEAAVSDNKWVFVDEVQRAPKILDIAQSLIDKKNGHFVFSGSSSRKLKRGAANLLAGRAYNFGLFPLTSNELANDFDLDQHLRFGGLPHVWNAESERDRVLFLRSYVTVYLKEEIAAEQIVRNLEPFAKFLQVAAQTSGQIINYANIAEDVGVSDQTVKTYFQILEDTLLGCVLPAYDRSVRKSQGKSPKFYLFDTGVLRTLQRTIDQPFDRNHFLYGLMFEHFFLHEIMRNSSYQGKDYQYSFLRVSNNHEIDLIIDRPGRPLAVIEIKSTTKVTKKHVDTLLSMKKDFKGADFYLVSQDNAPREYEDIRCLHWQAAIMEI